MTDIASIRESLTSRALELRSAAEELALIDAALEALDTAPDTKRLGVRTHTRGDATRSRVLQAVAETPAATASELSRTTGIAYATTTKALGVLADQGLVQRSEDKRWSPAS